MATSAEGKRLALCDLCDKNIPAKYCQTCKGSLCTQCVEDHSKIRIFKGHTVTDLPAHDITQSRFKSGGTESGLSRCPKHLDKELDSFCKTCSCFICTDCKSSHGGHAIQSAKDDIQLYHGMCRKHIQSLLDGVHELEEYKQLIDKVFQAYDEATGVVDEWETDLLDHVRDKATKLREELKSEKDEWIKILENLKTEAANIQENADKEINNLNEVRKSQECEILSQKLAETQNLLTELLSFKQKSQTKPEVPKIDRLLPNVSAIPKAKADIDTAFTKSASSKVSPLAANLINTGTKGGIKHDSLRLQHDIPIQQPKSKGGYRICRGRLDKCIILHGVGLKTSDIRAVNLVEMTIEKPDQKCNVDFFNMVALMNNMYIAKTNCGNQLHLLNEKFATFSLIKPENEVRAIAHAPNGRLVTLEKRNKKCFVNYTKVDRGHLRHEVFVSLDGDHWELGVHPDTKRCVLHCSGKFYEVDWKSASVNSFQVMDNYYFARSLALDAKYIYSAAGKKITAVDESHNAKCILDIGTQASICDMVVDNDKIIVSTTDNRILIYY